LLSVNVANYLKEQIGHNVLDEVEVIRHKTNIGGDANFQRCFELCNTPYIWMLGDDDKIENNALEIILKEIAAIETMILLELISVLIFCIM
jgi:hypothetical protein